MPMMDTDVDCNTDSDSRKGSPSEEQQPAPGKFVVVKLAGKRTTKGYVGVILGRNEDGDWKVDFYRREPNGGFVKPPQPDESYVDPDQIVRVLEAPTSLGTTARTRGCIGFNSNFSDLPFAMG